MARKFIVTMEIITDGPDEYIFGDNEIIDLLIQHMDYCEDIIKGSFRRNFGVGKGINYRSAKINLVFNNNVMVGDYDR